MPSILTITLTVLGSLVVISGLVRASITWHRHRDPEVGLIYTGALLIISPWLIETLTRVML